MLRRTLLISALASTLALAVPAHAATKTDGRPPRGNPPPGPPDREEERTRYQSD